MFLCNVHSNYRSDTYMYMYGSVFCHLIVLLFSLSNGQRQSWWKETSEFGIAKGLFVCLLVCLHLLFVAFACLLHLFVGCICCLLHSCICLFVCLYKKTSLVICEKTKSGCHRPKLKSTVPNTKCQVQNDQSAKFPSHVPSAKC